MPRFMWIQRQDIGPPPRSEFGMTFDPVRGVTVLFGGQSGATLFGDTWEWDGAYWTQVADMGPVPRVGHTLTYDVIARRCVLFGGAGGGTLADTWSWDGTYWTQL